MNIEDFEIKFKKYESEESTVIVNIIICGLIEIRGYRAKFGYTTTSKYREIWFVSPPSVETKKRKKTYFHVIRINDLEFWKQLESRIIDIAKEHTGLGV